MRVVQGWQYGLPQIQPDEVLWGNDVKAADQLFPQIFIERHALKDRQAEILWWHLEDPDLTAQEIASRIAANPNQVRNDQQILRHEFRCSSMKTVIVKARKELEVDTAEEYEIEYSNEYETRIVKRKWRTA